SARKVANAERRTLVWILFLSTACLVTASTLFGAGYGLPPWWQFLALALVTAGAERQSVRLTRNVETSVAFLPFVFTAVAFGPLSALVVGVFANALDIRRPYLRWAIYIPARGLTGAIIGVDGASQIPTARSEEHTSELQSQVELVC